MVLSKCWRRYGKWQKTGRSISVRLESLDPWQGTWDFMLRMMENNWEWISGSHSGREGGNTGVVHWDTYWSNVAMQCFLNYVGVVGYGFSTKRKIKISLKLSLFLSLLDYEKCTEFLSHIYIYYIYIFWYWELNSEPSHWFISPTIVFILWDRVFLSS